MMHGFTYSATLAASETIRWRVEDIIGGEKRLDFSRPFMPDSLAQVQSLPVLGSWERLLLNQIRGLEYLYLIGMVEEFILPFVVDHARPDLHGDVYRTRAYLQFAAEEAKHIHLFRRFRAEFEAGFGTPCELIGPPEAVARAVLAHHPLAVALVILQLEWMTQHHYLESVQLNDGLDPLFRSLLRHHWMEEAQHAKLDTLMVESLATGHSGEEIDAAVGEYAEIGKLLDGGLKQQNEFNIRCLERVTGRELSAAVRGDVLAQQRQAQRWTYLGSGMTHPNFLATLERLRPAARTRVAAMASLYS